MEFQTTFSKVELSTIRSSIPSLLIVRICLYLLTCSILVRVCIVNVRMYSVHMHTCTWVSRRMTEIRISTRHPRLRDPTLGAQGSGLCVLNYCCFMLCVSFVCSFALHRRLRCRVRGLSRPRESLVGEREVLDLVHGVRGVQPPRVYVCMYLCMYVGMYVCVYVCMYVCE